MSFLDKYRMRFKSGYSSVELMKCYEHVNVLALYVLELNL